MQEITVKIDIEKLENETVKAIEDSIIRELDKFVAYDSKPIIKELIKRLVENKILETAIKIVNEYDDIEKECKKEIKNKIMRRVEKLMI